MFACVKTKKAGGCFNFAGATNTAYTGIVVLAGFILIRRTCVKKEAGNTEECCHEKK